ncbi:hypothetical protein T310_3016 [Rasamsonia emersonii CBS 393.64]|uniref:DUF6594 domain-containing protein n=1 Tax=Rasamsonia emersonii (strain ATCC 16479 / CBS 393.64 / IMI 116815) TaxID=1408163 RepID=A0A0F4YXY8_RASE3|nr:hypothetical protein T310_3016 [Rasamsonia emersonii CBS 393.64]KKA22965.1 hypothetical protein T310_3016 [Rasamsonia emersonii CBS 393.64]
MGVVHEIITNNDARPDQMELARKLLSEYVSAIRDFDFMTEKQMKAEQNGTPDPFQITTKDLLGYYLMNDTEHCLLNDSRCQGKVSRPSEQHWKSDKYIYNILPGFSRGEYNTRIDLANFWERITMGLLGGLALIGPMLLMVLHKDLLTTLVTASVSTILFAVALSFFTQLQGQTVLASVAAYAAVLVVFVGSNS